MGLRVTDPPPCLVTTTVAVIVSRPVNSPQLNEIDVLPFCCARRYGGLFHVFTPANGLGTDWEAYIAGAPDDDQVMLVTDHGLPPGAPPEVITLKLTCPEIRFCEPATSWMLERKFSVGFCSPVPGIDPLAPVNEVFPLVGEAALTLLDWLPATVPVADQV